MPATKTAAKTFKVIRDNREQKGWVFPPSGPCEGTVVKMLPTGDYSIEGLESNFVIERKRSVAEWANNLGSDWTRFKAELVRLDAFSLPFIVLEFTLADLLRFPEGAGLPPRALAAVKISPAFLLKRTLEIEVAHKAKIIFAGPHGWEVASSLFKRVLENAVSQGQA